jgi:hypothetical protein
MNVISSGKIKTRKLHNCWGCKIEIPIGTQVQRVTSTDSGKIATVYWCDCCQIIIQSLDPYDLENGFEYGELKEIYEYPQQYQGE